MRVYEYVDTPYRRPARCGVVRCCVVFFGLVSLLVRFISISICVFTALNVVSGLCGPRVATSQIPFRSPCALLHERILRATWAARVGAPAGRPDIWMTSAGPFHARPFAPLYLATRLWSARSRSRSPDFCAPMRAGAGRWCSGNTCESPNSALSNSELA